MDSGDVGWWASGREPLGVLVPTRGSLRHIGSTKVRQYWRRFGTRQGTSAPLGRRDFRQRTSRRLSGFFEKQIASSCTPVIMSGVFRGAASRCLARRAGTTPEPQLDRWRDHALGIRSTAEARVEVDRFQTAWITKRVEREKEPSFEAVRFSFGGVGRLKLIL